MLVRYFFVVVFFCTPFISYAVNIVTNNCLIILDASSQLMAIIPDASCSFQPLVFGESLSTDATTRTPLVAIPSSNLFAAIDYASSSLLIYTLNNGEAPSLMQTITDNMPASPISIAASPDGSVIAVISSTVLSIYNLKADTINFCAQGTYDVLQEVAFLVCRGVSVIFLYTPTGITAVTLPVNCPV